MRYPLTFLTCVMMSAVAFPALAAEPGAAYERRWVYLSANLQVDKSADDMVELVERSAKAGYNGILFSDYKLNVLDRVIPSYFRNAERLKKAADAARMELIPAVFAIGYSNGLLAHDPNLAEGIQVEAAPFLIRRREAVPVLDAATKYANGDLESTKGDAFTGFGFQDDPGKTTFADRSVVHGGSVSCRIEDVGKNSSTGNARLTQKVKVRPRACYRFSCWVKTKKLAGAGNFQLLASGAGEGGRRLTFHEGGVAPDQDWTEVDVVFNSLDQREVNLYAGIWGGDTGTLWIDDLKLEELSLVNILRRDGCPLRVTSNDGRTVFEEGRDFEPVRDPQLGNIPYAGEYEFKHAPPRIRLTAQSRIREGAKIRVSWYHPVPVHGSQVMCCVSDPKVYTLLRDQARKVNQLFHPRMFFMSHDEIRVMNWCRACQMRKLTPGQLLADNVKRCTQIAKEVNSRVEVATWSDMFDPNHNAVAKYYLINGSLEGSWEGLSRDVLIANWNSGKAKASLEWFANRGHRQIIAGYYDGDDLSNFRDWTAAAHGILNVEGFMYTTWQNKYGLLEQYGAAMRGGK
jgi:hypothetical protein